jgi:hypothetical protein
MTCAKLPTRPPKIDYDSISGLYQQYVEIFLIEGRNPLVSPCGHEIVFFDHHFFHMAGITVAGKEKLFMREEKGRILETIDGFGEYRIGHGGSRAKHFHSTYDTLASPAEIWEDNPKAKARWVYVKEYDSLPYQFSVVMVTTRPEASLIVPVTGFPCKRKDVKKWRQGNRIHP